MKPLQYFLVIAAIGLCCSINSYAQSKIGWFNSQAIMEKYPESQDAQHQLDNLVADWQAELAKMQNEWKKKFEEYDKKKLILTDQLRAEAEKELRDLDQKIGDYRNKKFGKDGELFQKQNELMKPVQNKIYKILEEVAKDEGYDYIFDKSGEILLMYSNPDLDVTQKVLEKLTNFSESNK
ncbi:MAG: OmpH family outer membrane protein [Bacteroidetes bacterium]|nr:MAG: OmpH family outer membrane protein [Bacteroidota bacterium]